MNEPNIELSLIRSKEFRSLNRKEKSEFIKEYKAKYFKIPINIRNKWWTKDKNRSLVNKINQYIISKGASEEESDEDIIEDQILTIEEKILQNRDLMKKAHEFAEQEMAKKSKFVSTSNAAKILKKLG